MKSKISLASFKHYFPDTINPSKRERARSILGAALGIFLTGVLSQSLIGSGSPLPWLIAPMGASAVLLFALPASPLAQPWSILGGNLISAIAGLLCAKFIAIPVAAAALAVGIAITLMFALRCTHPPGGAIALGSALSGPAIAQHGLHFVLSPVVLNSAILLALGISYNKLCKRRYPHLAHDHGNQHKTADAVPGERLGLTPADVDEALKQYNEALDVSRDDLEEILLRAEANAYQRRFGKVTCGDIMSRDVVKAEFGTGLRDAWRLMREHRIKALPVVNAYDRVIGIVTQHDFLMQCDPDTADGLIGRLTRFLKPSRQMHSDKAEVVGQIMTTKVRSATTDLPIASIVPLFSDAGLHHLPVVDGNGRLAGIVTQSDLVAALYRSQSGPHEQKARASIKRVA